MIQEHKLRPRRGMGTFGEVSLVLLLIVTILVVARWFYFGSVRPDRVREVKSNAQVIALAVHAYHDRTKSYPKSLEELKELKVLSSLPEGPCSVTYSIQPVNEKEFKIVATEHGEDAFGTTAVNESVTYTILGCRFIDF